MSEDKLTYSDIHDYESLFTMAPPFLLESFAKRNSNLVLKFKPTIQPYINNLTSEQKHKLDLILNSDVGELQAILYEAFLKTNKKQFKILADPKYRDFIELNLNEIRQMV